MIEYDDKTIIEKLNECWTNSNSKHLFFPGPQPISIERKHIQHMKNSPNDYLCGVKNDGIRYMICCTKDQKNRNIFSIFNRNFSQKLLKIKAKREIFDGTLIDSEYIEDTNTFILFDCIMINGFIVSHLSFSERMTYLKTFLSAFETTDYNFIIKEFTPFSEFKHLVQHQTQQLKSDGYVFMPNKSPICIGTHNLFFKWKQVLDNTVDFAINPLGNLYLINKGNFVKTRNKLEHIPKYIMDMPVENMIVECKCIDLDKKIWLPLSVRKDKNIPNSTYVYKKTIQNIKDDININEFF